jgi:hypothetical protein
MQITSNIPAHSTSLSPATSDKTNSIVIEISPGANNVDSGDRSKNTAEISVTTPNKSSSTEISREQTVNAVERRIQKNALQQLGGSNNSFSNPLLVSAVKSGAIDSEQLDGIGTALYQRRIAQTYINAYQTSLSGLYSPATPNNNSLSPAGSSSGTGVNLANQAVNAYIKQTLFFSGIDQAKSTFSAQT